MTFTGDLGFFNSTAQFAVESASLGNVNNADYARYAELLNPWEISAADLNILNADGTHEINIANYGEYNGAYVKIANSVVSMFLGADQIGRLMKTVLEYMYMIHHFDLEMIEYHISLHLTTDELKMANLFLQLQELLLI